MLRIWPLLGLFRLLELIRAHPPSGAIVCLQGAMDKSVRLASPRLAGDRWLSRWSYRCLPGHDGYLDGCLFDCQATCLAGWLVWWLGSNDPRSVDRVTGVVLVFIIYQMGENTTIIRLSIGMVASIAFFNVCGIATTKIFGLRDALWVVKSFWQGFS